MEYTFYTDASSTGGRGFHLVEQNLTVGQRWSVEEKSLHINVLESKAVLFAILSCLKTVFHSAIMIFSDNTTTVQALKAQGTTKSFSCNKIVRKILRFCEEHDIHLNIAHIAGEKNQIADTASRQFRNLDTEWSISQERFDKICEIFGVPEIDMFASRLNKKLKKFCSWHPDPEANFIDAFSVDLESFNYSYSFPPFSLISRVLKFLNAHPHLNILMIVPLWTGQAWWPMLVRHLIDLPLEIQKSDHTLILPQLPNHLHPRRKHIQMCAVKLSGNNMRLKAFRKKLPRLSSHCDRRRQIASIVHILTNGSSTQRKKTSIPWHQSLIR